MALTYFISVKIVLPLIATLITGVGLYIYLSVWFHLNNKSQGQSIGFHYVVKDNALTVLFSAFTMYLQYMIGTFWPSEYLPYKVKTFTILNIYLAS